MHCYGVELFSCLWLQEEECCDNKLGVLSGKEHGGSVLALQQPPDNWPHLVSAEDSSSWVLPSGQQRLCSFFEGISMSVVLFLVSLLSSQWRHFSIRSSTEV